MPNRWGAGNCGKCCKSCKYCLQAINLLTGAPYTSGYIGGTPNPLTQTIDGPTYPITGPDYTVCITAPGGLAGIPFVMPYVDGQYPGAYSPDNPLNTNANVYLNYQYPETANNAIALKVVSAVSTGGAPCPSSPCGCDPLPPTVTMSVTVPDPFGYIQSATFVYGPAPAGYTDGSGPYSWWSTASVPIVLPVYGAMNAYYELGCLNGQYFIAVVVPWAQSLLGAGTTRAIAFYPPGSGGSTCSPLLLNGINAYFAEGIVMVGGGPSAVITL